jgi:hypothetical protein
MRRTLSPHGVSPAQLKVLLKVLKLLNVRAVCHLS